MGGLGHGPDPGLDRAGDRRGATGLHLVVRASDRLYFPPRQAALDARVEAARLDRGPCRAGRRRGADQSAGRAAGCQFYRRRRRLADLCRPPVSTAIGRGRHCHRHRAAARPVAPPAHGRCRGQPRLAEPRGGICPGHDSTRRRGACRHRRALVCRPVPARRLQAVRHRSHRHRAGNLRARPAGLRAAQSVAAAVFRPRRQPQPVSLRCGLDDHQCRAGDWPDAMARLCRRSLGHDAFRLGHGLAVVARLAQDGSGSRVRRPFPSPPAPDHRGFAADGGRPLAWRVGPRPAAARPSLALSRPSAAGRARRGQLFRHRHLDRGLPPQRLCRPAPGQD